MKVFALRMVNVATVPRWRLHLRGLVRECLERLEGNNSWPIFEDWDHSERHPDDDGTAGFAWRHPRELLCDEVQRFIWAMQEIGELPNYGDSEKRSRMEVLLTCCIRAAADIAAAPSAGVYGWTVGDLKKMWPKCRVPKWVTENFETDLLKLPDDTQVGL